MQLALGEQIKNIPRPEWPTPLWAGVGGIFWGVQRTQGPRISSQGDNPQGARKGVRLTPEESLREDTWRPPPDVLFISFLFPLGNKCPQLRAHSFHGGCPI